MKNEQAPQRVFLLLLTRFAAVIFFNIKCIRSHWNLFALLNPRHHHCLKIGNHCAKQQHGFFDIREMAKKKNNTKPAIIGNLLIIFQEKEQRTNGKKFVARDFEQQGREEKKESSMDEKFLCAEVGRIKWKII